jgi:hypothetical protein
MWLTIGKSDTGGRISMHEKLAWRPKGRQLNDLITFFFNLARGELVKLSSLWSLKLFSNYLILFSVKYFPAENNVIHIAMD